MAEHVAPQLALAAENTGKDSLGFTGLTPITGGKRPSWDMKKDSLASLHIYMLFVHTKKRRPG